MRILLPLSPGSSTPRRLLLTYSSPLHSALSSPFLASYTTAVRRVGKSTCCFPKKNNWPWIRNYIQRDLKSGKFAIASVSFFLTLGFPGSPTCCQLSNLIFSACIFQRWLGYWVKTFLLELSVIVYSTMFNLMAVSAPNTGFVSYSLNACGLYC